MKHLIIDTTNILWRVAAARGKYHTGGTPEEQAGLALHMSLQVFNKLYKTHAPDRIAVTFEGARNWRKEYTRSSECLSGRVYKANRVRDDSMAHIFELIRSFENLVKNHTSLICLSNPILEGDDLFAGYVQRYTAVGDTVIGVSGDKDFVQLLKHPNFTLINPDTYRPRQLEDVCGSRSADFFMFEKAMRGDRGDNVFPALPRVQKKRLLRCMSDDYELTQLMNETWNFTDPETGRQQEFSVRQLFEENNLLMNLECQPAHIRQAIDETIDSAIKECGKFSFFHFSKFCGQHGLKQVIDNAQQFANMFSVSARSAAPARRSALEF